MNLDGQLQSSSCDFGDGFETQNTPNNDKIEMALLAYQYATQFRDDISRLDANESGYTFVGPDTIDHSGAITALPTTPALTAGQAIAANGAFSWKLNAIAGSVPGGKEVFLELDVTGGDAWISITSLQSLPSRVGDPFDPFDHAWFKSSELTEFIYGSNVPELFVTVVNPSATSSVTAKLGRGFRDLTIPLVVTAPTANQQLSNRVIDVTGTIPSSLLGTVTQVVVRNSFFSGAENLATITGSSFAGRAVIGLGENAIIVEGLNALGDRVTRSVVRRVVGVISGTPAQPNALIESSVVYVLTWDRANDVDLYVTDPQSRTIWFADREIPSVGRLDFDSGFQDPGFGPEVITFFANGPSLPGVFDVDVHYYSDNGLGDPPTDFAVDVILNESNASEKVGFRFVSSSPLTNPDLCTNNVCQPGSTGPSWANDVVRVSCDGATGMDRKCSLIQ